jgi:nitroreductase
MNNFAELVKNRRSTRNFTEEKLTAAEVEQIMKTALMAPTSKNGRSWNFVLVEDKEVLRQLSLCRENGSSFIEQCALAIVIVSDPVQSAAPIEDSTIAATYIQLQAEDLGLGSCWSQITGRETADGGDSEQYIRDILGIPYPHGVECVIAIGHKARIGKPHDEDALLWEKVHVGTF